MNDKLEKDTGDFIQNKFDFGLKPADYPLSDEQKKISVLAMAMNAAVVQFIFEGLISTEHQLHFMGHLQDYANRLYNGESVKMPYTSQTLQINSKAGNLFYEAAEIAFKQGSDNFKKINEEARKLQAQAEALLDQSDKRTLN